MSNKIVEEEKEMVLGAAAIEDELALRRASGGKAKKGVRFADDCGKCLEMIRVMTEPSDYPPKISPGKNH
jgi:hypothetical protein